MLQLVKAIERGAPHSIMRCEATRSAPESALERWIAHLLAVVDLDAGL